MIGGGSILGWLREQPGGLARLSEFNFHPARSAHRGHFSRWMSADLAARLLATPHGEASLSRLLLAEGELAGEACWDLTTDRRRLALLEAPTLSRLLDCITVAACLPDLGRIIDKTSRQTLKSKLDSAAWEFAAKRASTLTSSVWPSDPSLTEPKDPAARVLFLRRCVVAAWSAGEPASVQQRLWWKLDPECSDAPLPAVTPAQDEFLWHLTRKLLRTDFRTEWQACSV